MGSDITLERVKVADVPSMYHHTLDLLFVVDNSQGMEQRQDELAASFQRLSKHLEFHSDPLDRVFDLNVRVISTDMGVGERWASTISGCTAFGDDGRALADHARDVFSDPYASFLHLRRLHHEIQERNYHGDLATAFSRLSRIGSHGCRFEQPLAAMKAAFDRDFDFPRPGAALAVVFLSTEDDCSIRDTEFFGPDGHGGDKHGCFEQGVRCEWSGDDVGPTARCTAREDSPYVAGVDEYVEWLRGMMDPDDIVVAGMVGDSDLVEIVQTVDDARQVAAYRCEGDVASYPAVRLQSFIEAFHDHGQVSPLCGSRSMDALTDTARRIRTTLGTSCLTRPIYDFDPETFAVDNDCWVSVVYSNGTSESIPACPGPGHQREDSPEVPCHVIDRGGEACGDFFQQSLDVWWGRGPEGERAQPEGTRVVAECLVEPG